MGKDEAVSMESIMKVCNALSCYTSDVMELERDFGDSGGGE